MTNLDFLSPQQVADLLGVTYETLSMWRTRGMGPAYHKLGTGPRGTVRYQAQDVQDFIERTRVSTKESAPA